MKKAKPKQNTKKPSCLDFGSIEPFKSVTMETKLFSQMVDQYEARIKELEQQIYQYELHEAEQLKGKPGVYPVSLALLQPLSKDAQELIRKFQEGNNE